MDLSKDTGNELLYVGFNQDYGCFACGTDSGFRIYNCDPFKETFRRDFSSGGIGLVEMLFRCNILALVGGGRNPRYPPHKVMIWDDHQNRCIGELSFRSNVKSVKLRRDRVVVVLNNKIYVYNFADLNLLHHIETVANPKGLCAVCPSSTNTVLACPGLQRGHVRVELYDIRKTTLIAAHETDLACMALNLSGTRLATASEKGTLIRVYDTSSGDLLQELRRGVDKAEIYSICFNPLTSHLACSSDKGTIHVFMLKKDIHDVDGSEKKEPDVKAPAALTAGSAADAAAGDAAGAADGVGAGATAPAAAGGAGGAADSSGGAGGGAVGGAAGGSSGGAAGGAGAPASESAGGGGASGDSTSNHKSSLSFMRGLLPKYFSSEWSFAQFRVPETKTICAFGAEPNTIIAVAANGCFFKANFEKGGEAVRSSYSQFVRSGTES